MPILTRCLMACVAALCGVLVAHPTIVAAQGTQPSPIYPVGIRQIEYVDAGHGGRRLALAMFYPAVIHDRTAPFVMPFFTNLHLYRDAPLASGGAEHPLVVFSHGRGSNGLYYAWFAESLASHGYVVAAPYHYRANTYDSTIAYLANKLWQRPVDVALDISFLLHDPSWASAIDARRIGVARINPDRYLAFQRGWRSNPMVPEHLRQELPVDARPALDVHDPRVKAVFAMAPGIVQTFGMDEAGLRQLTVPAYITVGAGDTQTPPKDNAEFAAKHIPHAELYVIPGRVDHEIFVNECDQEGKDELPEACIDAPGVDRRAIHDTIAKAALTFFDTNLDAKRAE